jgi:hypothetical protein
VHVRIGEIERIDPYGHVNVIPGERSSSPPLRTEVHARSRPGSNGPWRSAVRFKSSNGLPATVALQRETRTIPIVFANLSDPVASGIVPGLNQPGGNISGFAGLEATLGGKWLELLSEIAPGLKRAAIMFNPDAAPVSIICPQLKRRKTMNPCVPQRVIDEALARDPAKYGAEYLSEFRSDLEAFVSREVVEACVAPGVYERPPISGISYFAFVDPSGGSGLDSMTLAIAHRDGDRVVLDAVRERRPPFSPDDVVAEFAALLKSYGISSVRGDRFGGEWPRERFRSYGIHYEVADKVKSDIYRDVLPLLNSGRVDLLDYPRLVAQLCSLERRTARGGRDSIDHPAGSHDDVINSVAGALISLAPTGADGWIAYIKGLADRAQGLRVPAERAPYPTDNAVAEAYRRIIKRETDKVERCDWCGEGLGSSRTTDGEASYHDECYQTMLSKGRKTDAA